MKSDSSLAHYTKYLFATIKLLTLCLSNTRNGLQKNQETVDSVKSLNQSWIFDRRYCLQYETTDTKQSMINVHPSNYPSYLSIIHFNITFWKYQSEKAHMIEHVLLPKGPGIKSRLHHAAGCFEAASQKNFINRCQTVKSVVVVSVLVYLFSSQYTSAMSILLLMRFESQPHCSMNLVT